MSPSFRAGWIAAAMGEDNLCYGGTVSKQMQYRAGHAAYLAQLAESGRQAVEPPPAVDTHTVAGLQ